VTETEAILILCALLGGDNEVTHRYSINEGSYSIRVDCETDTRVIEVGLDKRSSLDSVQQAEFAGWLTGKTPVVALIDTDGVEGRFEYRIETTANRFGVDYVTYSQDYLRRWQMTQYFRDRRIAKTGS